MRLVAICLLASHAASLLPFGGARRRHAPREVYTDAERARDASDAAAHWRSPQLAWPADHDALAALTLLLSLIHI